MKQVQSRPKTELVSATSAIEARYSRADLRARITDALQAAGNSSGRPRSDHRPRRPRRHPSRGSPAGHRSRTRRPHTIARAKLRLPRDDRRSDATGLSERITVMHADALNLPFADGSFDVVWSQHAQMNIADKRRFYREARRVLKHGGRLAIWDIIAGPIQPIHFPVPWADTPDISFLAQSDELRQIVEEARFEITAWNDRTSQTIESLRAQMAGPAGPTGLQTYVPNFPAKTANLLLNLKEQRIRMLQAVFTCE